MTVAFAFIVHAFKPVKYAITKQDAYKCKKEFIVVKNQKATVSPWIAIGDTNGAFSEEKNTRIIGNEPTNFNYSIECGDNTFICYGKYKEYNHTDEAGTYDIFQADTWDILYPIKRTELFDFYFPKSFICKMDLR